ncbi:MAG: DNA primase [Chloroflexi bacterium]|nr:DNA primase [Chloroflexota bacterium]MCL5274386.1 DNA primase [Chloroflexota bacterium]
MSVVDEVRSRIDIVDVIGAYVKLTRSGRSFKGLSPFQNERTPSFFVFPETQTFKDFSSGEQGDAFSFLMKKEGMTFPEALRELAQRAGVEVEQQTDVQRRNEGQEERLRAALSEAAGYFHQLLLSAPQAANCRTYIREKRALSDETIHNWQLGYSLMDYHALSNFLSARGFTLQELIDAGLVIENEEGRRYDRFRGRLIIPIRDEKGRAVGFGSRSLDGSEPKYMNSPQTPVFDKGRLLFGLDRARIAIRNEQTAVLVEGYMDVIGTHQAGFTNVVAGMGTSLTESQLKMLKRLTPRIVLALDPDAAGDRAVLRDVDVARDSLERDETPTFDARGVIRHESKLNADIRVAIMPDGLDPDEIVLQSPQRWRDAIAQARPVVDHVIDTLLARYDIEDPHGKSEAVKAVAPIVRDLSDPVRRDYYTQQLARKLRINPRAIALAMAAMPRAETRRAEREQPPAAGAAAPLPVAASGEGAPQAAKNRTPQTASRPDLETHMVALIARHPALLMDANVALTRANLDMLGQDDFSNPALRAGFVQLSRAATGQTLPEADDDWLELIADVQLTIDAPGSGVDEETVLREETVLTALRLREQNLRRDGQATALMIDDAQTRNDRPATSQYNHQLLDVNAKLLRAQKALRLRSMVTIT